MALIRVFILMICTGLAAGCVVIPPPLDRDADVLVVGDSIFAWHRGTGRSIPVIAERTSGVSITDRSVAGARFMGSRGIAAQYVPGDWDTVLFDGGGNDISPVCGEPWQRAVLERLISADGTRGAIPDFARRVVADGADAIVMGYFGISAQGGPFAPCKATLDELRLRQMRMAQALDRVTFVDTREVIAPDDMANYAPDLVHPSPTGAALIGRLIGGVLME